MYRRAFKPISLVRFYTTPEVPLLPSAVQLWEAQQLEKAEKAELLSKARHGTVEPGPGTVNPGPGTVEPELVKKIANSITEKSDLFSHEFYVPVPKVDTCNSYYTN